MGGCGQLLPQLDGNDSNDSKEDSGTKNKKFDIILLTDCVFSSSLVPDLINTILLFSHSKTTVMVCHEIRDEDANNYFLQEFSKYFSSKSINKSKLHPNYCNEHVKVVIGKPKRKKANTLKKE